MYIYTRFHKARVQKQILRFPKLFWSKTSSMQSISDVLSNPVYGLGRGVRDPFSQQLINRAYHRLRPNLKSCIASRSIEKVLESSINISFGLYAVVISHFFRCLEFIMLLFCWVLNEFHCHNTHLKGPRHDGLTLRNTMTKSHHSLVDNKTQSINNVTYPNDLHASFNQPTEGRQKFIVLLLGTFNFSST